MNRKLVCSFALTTVTICLISFQNFMTIKYCGRDVVNNSQLDARPVIEQCIKSASPGSTISFYPGIYNFKTPMSISEAPANLTLVTDGATSAQSGCLSPSSNFQCAIFKADENFDGHSALVTLSYARGLQMRSIGFDGNGKVRVAKAGPSYERTAPMPTNVDIHYCSNCSFYGVGSANAFWASAFRVFSGDTVEINFSYFGDNGASPTVEEYQNNIPAKYPADGITTGANISGLRVENSEFRENTDVHLIIGACQNAVLKGNTFSNTQSFIGAAIYLANWDINSNNLTNYTGTRVTENRIVCAPGKCSIGISVGEVMWAGANVTQVYGASISGNTISGAKQGIEIAGARNIEVTSNHVINTGNYISKDGAVRTSQIDVNASTTSQISVSSNVMSMPVTNGVGMLNPALNTFGGPNYIMAMIQDPFVSHPRTAILTAGNELLAGQGIRSFSGQYTFLHQPDGNVVLYKGVFPVWSTGTQGRISRTIAMQTDGNFVLYSNKDYPLWNSMTWSNRGARFAVQDDGNIVVYAASGTPLWSRFR